MNKIIMGRRFGKTYNLVKLSAIKQIPILCAYSHSKITIKEKAKELGVIIPEPLSVRDIWDKGIRLEEVLVDDAERVLEYMLKGICGANIHTLTFTLGEDSFRSMI